MTRGWTLDLSIATLDEDAQPPGKKKGDKKTGEDHPDGKRDRASPDFTVELVTTSGAKATCEVSRFAAIPPPLKQQFTKLGRLESIRYTQDWEPVFQTVSLPMDAFAGIDPAELATVRLKFDRTAESVICLSRIGFCRPTN